MYNKIFKNNQVNLGTPFQVKIPINFHTIKTVEKPEELEEIAEAVEDPCDLLARAKEEAELILKEAELEAARVIEKAEFEASERKAAIEGEAWQKGYDDGLQAAKGEYEALLQEAESIREQAKTEYNEVLAGIECDAVDMVLEISRKVIGDEIEINKDSVLSLIKHAFERCGCKEGIILKVSADDYDYIVENREKILAVSEGIGDFETKKDLSLKSGDCIVETSFGTIDAGMRTKLKKIEEAFKQAVGR